MKGFVVVSVIVISAIFAIALFLYSSRNERGVSNPQSEAQVRVTPQIEHETEVPVTTISEVLSPDGTMLLRLEEIIEDGKSMYSLFSRDIKTGDEVSLHSFEFEEGVITLPDNAWSPDNRYVFVIHEMSDKTYYVLKSNGEVFPDGREYINARLVFDTKNTGVAMSEITGWDSDSLLHVFTQNDGEQGPSYRFVVPGGGVYRLSSR